MGTPHCPICGKEIKQQTIDQIIDQVLELPEATRIQVMAPVIRGKKGEHAKVFEDARPLRLCALPGDGITYDLSEEIKLEKNKKHSIEIVVDRLVIRDDIARRLTDSVEIASGLSGGLVVINVVGEGPGHPVLPELRLRGLRRVHRGAHPPDVLLQQPLRGLPPPAPAWAAS